MFKTLKNILKTGNATVGYPYEPLETTPHMRGKPDHSLTQCIACAACAVACPPNAIQMRADQVAGTISWSINYGRCIFCGRCEEACPVGAIRLTDEFELAVMSKDDLFEECTYALAACSRCGKYYAPRKEVDYACRVLANARGNSDARLAAELTGVCPACKRADDAERSARRASASGKR